MMVPFNPEIFVLRFRKCPTTIIVSSLTVLKITRDVANLQMPCSPRSDRGQGAARCSFRGLPIYSLVFIHLHLEAGYFWACLLLLLLLFVSIRGSRSRTRTHRHVAVNNSLLYVVSHQMRSQAYLRIIIALMIGPGWSSITNCIYIYTVHEVV